MKFILGKPENYCSQRNNNFRYKVKDCKIDASCMCNVTAMSEALEIGEWIMPSGEYSQNEDNLADFIVYDKAVNEFYKTHFPAMYKQWENHEKDCYTPIEVHKVLEFGVNAWLGCSHADTFIESCAINDLIKQLWYVRMPIPISVKFGNLNHIVLLEGFETSMTESELAKAINNKTAIKIDKWYYDDPYGAFDWKSKTYPANRGPGDDQVLTNAQFNESVKPLGNARVKYAHILHKPAAVV